MHTKMMIKYLYLKFYAGGTDEGKVWGHFKNQGVNRGTPLEQSFIQDKSLGSKLIYLERGKFVSSLTNL